MKKEEVYLGVDVGSVSTNFVLTKPEKGPVVKKLYVKTQGNPILAIKEGLRLFLEPACEVVGVGVTGSGRHLAAAVLGADVVKNEITAHALAAFCVVPSVSTVIEIGGQDSKIILLREGVVVDFAMNTVCAAGTGSFLEQQAQRLGIKLEEVGALAKKSKNPLRIAGRCTVFAESDMIHKQQVGHSLSDILAGLCSAIARNFLNNVGKGKQIREEVVFQGGVAANGGMIEAFSKLLSLPIHVPPDFDVMGALGACYLSEEYQKRTGKQTKFRGFSLLEEDFRIGSILCRGCANSCELVQVFLDNALLEVFGARCGNPKRVAIS